MAKKVYVGVSGVARRASRIYVGVSGVARRVKKIYVGVNGVARKCYPMADPINIFTQSGGVNSSAVTSLSRDFQYQTSGGQNYTMFKMARSGSSPNYYWSGSMSDGAGNAEYAMFMVSSDDVAMANYDRLKVTFEYKFEKNGTSNGTVYFGAYKTASSYLTCKSSELISNFSAHKSYTLSNSTSYTEVTLTVNISAVTSNQRILFLLSYPNIKGSANIRIKKIWMD